MIDKEYVRQELKPLYEELLENNNFEHVFPFCIQWGENFPSAKNEGILFVGKAVNEWDTDETDVDILFGDSDERIFARDNQMKWVSTGEGCNGYNSNRSAFWRVNRKITQKFYPKDEWYSYVAWSNLYKLNQGGNPKASLCKEQFDSCKTILEKEIEIFSPKFVVMLTSGWERGFLTFLNGNHEPEIELTKNWGHVTNLHRINGVAYVATPHPQGKKEGPHVEVITELINNILDKGKA